MILESLKANMSIIPDDELLDIVNVASAEVKKRAGLESIGIPDIKNNSVEENLRVLVDALKQMGINIPNSP